MDRRDAGREEKTMHKRNMFKMAAAAAVLTLTAGTAFAQEIKIGFNGDISASPSAQSGQAGVLGLQAAIDDLNAAGGLLGRRLSLVVRDDLSQPPRSIQNMSDLIDNERVSMIIGPTNSGNALAWRHIPNQKRIPVIGFSGSATDITKPMAAGADNYMFRVSMVDRPQVAALMAYVKRNPASKVVGFMFETTGYGQGGLRDMQEIAAMHGIQPAATERFAVNDTDMTSQLNKLKAAGVDTLVVWAQGAPLGHLLRSMEKINYFPRLLTSWAADNKSFYDAAGPQLAERAIFLRTVTDERSARQQQLFDRVSPRLASTSSFPFAAHAYDGMMLYAAAVRQAGTIDGPKVREALESLQGRYDGIMKAYERPFSRTEREGLLASDFRWTHWKDGRLVNYGDDVVRSLRQEDFRM